VRSVDLALFADVLAGEAASLAARAERARAALRQAAIERAARRDVSPAAIDRLTALGILAPRDERGIHEELAELTRSLDALCELQAWVETRLAEAEDVVMPA
jgi:hypothetical protein